MKVWGIIGWKNAGKTSLVERLVAAFTARGLSVSTVKHVHHDVDLDQPGKDTFRHRQAGAAEVVLAGRHRYALLREHRTDEPPLAAVLARLSPVDLVLVEGYKRDTHAKIEVYRRGEGRRPIAPCDPTVQAVATDAPGDIPAGIPVLDLNDTDAVAGFILRATGLAPDGAAPPHPSPTTGEGWGGGASPPFDRVLIIDWSAAATPSPARETANAIWIGQTDATGDRPPRYFRTRHAAEAWLTDALALPGRSLIGFDFPMGYPTGFAARLTGQASAPAIWDWLARHIEDSPDNANNRFAVAAAINARLGGGPFWGRPEKADLPDLPFRKAVNYAALGLSEKRRAETRARSAQPVWKLAGAGAVGGQALTGLPLIHRLSQRPGVAVWPFAPTHTARVVLAEVYPSLLASAVRASEDAIPDRAQVRLLARALFHADRTGQLAAQMATPPEAAEEGWILGLNDPAALIRCAS